MSTGRDRLLRAKCRSFHSGEINLATDRSSTALVLPETMFQDTGTLAALWFVYSTAGTEADDLESIEIGVKNVAGKRDDTTDDDYFVASCTKTLQEARGDGAGFPFQEFTLAHTDIKRGDVLTIKFSPVSDGGYVRIFGLWYLSGEAVSIRANRLPTKFTAATTSTA